MSKDLSFLNFSFHVKLKMTELNFEYLINLIKLDKKTICFMK